MNSQVNHIHHKGKKPLIDLRMALLLGSQLFFCAVLAIFIIFQTPTSKKLYQGNNEYLRELANKLQVAGVIPEAIKYYQEYFKKVATNPKQKAQLAFTIANLLEKEGELEKALSFYYLVSIFDESSDYKADANRKIVAILEKLKKFNAAKWALKDSTTLQSKQLPSKQGGELIAKVGPTNIYLHEINEAIDQLPQQLQKNFKTLEGRKQFAQKFVADMLLFQKAKRLGVAEDAKFRKQLQRITKELMVNQIIENEIKQKISFSESDVKNFYTANPDKFKLPEHASISIIKVKKKELANKILKKLQKGKNFANLAKEHSLDQSSKENGGLLDTPVMRNAPFMGKSGEITNEILKSSTGDVVGPKLLDGFYFLIKVEQKIASKKYEYKDIKSQAEMVYRQEKEKELYQKLIQNTLKTEEVQFYMDKIK